MKYPILLTLLTIAFQAKVARKFTFINKCNETIWVGASGIPQPSSTGWQMRPNQRYEISIPSNTISGRFWARTECKWVDGKFKCITGDCGAPLNNFGVECNGITGQSPATLVEYTLNPNDGSDYYDLSNVDGFNIPVYFGPVSGTYRYVDNSNLGRFNCGAPGCRLNSDLCPRELKFTGENGRAYCFSICAAVYNNDQVQRNNDILGPIASDQMKKDLVCCACGPNNGGCTDSRSHYCCSPIDPRQNLGGKCYVQQWPKPSSNFDRYDLVFKNQCPDAYSWQFDDMQSTYQCKDADYDVVWCPDGSEWNSDSRVLESLRPRYTVSSKPAAKPAAKPVAKGRANPQSRKNIKNP